MNYTWTVINQDKNTIQFCVQQSGGYSNCASIPGSSTQTFAIPDIDVQIYGTPTGYYVYYTSVQVKTSTQSLPPSGSTITVPPFQGCDPLLTQGQGYPAIIPCQYPGIIFLKSESTPAMFIENWGAETAGFAHGYGVAGSQLGIATGPGWAYYRQYPAAQVYLIGNWAVDANGNYVDQDSGRKYCGCPGKSVYVIPISALPGPSSTTTSSGTGTQTTTSTGTTTGQQTTGTTQQTTRTTGILNVANPCSTGVVVNAGGKTAYAPPYHAISLEVPIPTHYTLISEGQQVGQGTVTKSGQYVSPQSCPSSPSPTPTPSPSPSGGTSTQTTSTTSTTTTTTTSPSQIPWEVLLVLVILGVLAMSS